MRRVLGLTAGGIVFFLTLAFLSIRTPIPASAQIPPTSSPTTPSTVQTAIVTIAADNQDGYQDVVAESAAFHISGDASNRNWVGSNPNVITGWIFPDVAVPKGVKILNARVSFRGFGTPGEATAWFTGFAEDDASVFSADGSNMPSLRPKTTSSVVWTNTWTVVVGERTSENLAPIIQEIINRPGWQPGNNIGLSIENPSGAGSDWGVFDWTSNELPQGPQPGDGDPINVGPSVIRLVIEYDYEAALPVITVP